MTASIKNIEYSDNNLVPLSQLEPIADNATFLIKRWLREEDKGVILAVIKAYVDESGTHGSADLMCVAACVFSDAGSEKFVKEFGPKLDSLRKTFFHATTDTAFPELYLAIKKLIERDCLLRCIKFADRKVLDDYEAQGDFVKFTGEKYSLLTLACVQKIADFAKELGHTVHYLFEQGDKESETELVGVMEQIRWSESLKEQFAFESYSFGQKKVIQLNAADFLAWVFTRGAKDATIPGFEPGKWESWLAKYVDVSGFTQLSAQIQAVSNAVAGIRVEPKKRKDAKIYPLTEEDFDTILQRVTRKVSQPSQSDSAK